jgi:hypothetical protein
MTNVIRTVNWWHERLAEWMLANPEKFIKDAAKEFQTSASYLYQIKNSDAFKIYWQEVSKGVKDDVKKAVVEGAGSLTGRAAAVSTQALDALAVRLDLQAQVMPVDTLIDISNLGLKSLGYAASKNNSAPSVTVNVNAVDPTALARARERMRQQFGLNSEPANEAPKLIEVTAEEVKAE